MKAVMSEAAREARRAYQRKWNAEHRDLVKRTQARYWERKAAAAARAEAAQEDADTGGEK